MQNNDLSDVAAQAECRRLLMVVNAQRRVQDEWFGGPATGAVPFDENSAFCMGMLSLFRYARGMSVPAALVMSFRDDLLKLLFCGLASNAMAIPSFSRMGDRPWAHALRMAEIRLAMAGEEEIDLARLAHLLGQKPEILRAKYSLRDLSGEEPIPGEKLQEICEDLS